MEDPGRSMLPLEVRLFGPFEVNVEDKPLSRLRTRKGQWLLALLSLRQGLEVPRAWLAGTLWSDNSEANALNNLGVTLNDLRKALGTQAYRIRSPTRRTLCLDLSGALADVALFDAAIGRADMASLQEAVSLYRGPLLEGCLEEWVFQERQAREQSYLSAQEKLAEVALGRGDPDTAARHLRAVIALDPLRESAQRALMQALAASGDYAAVVLVYRELRLLLYRELHAEPDVQTTALFQQLRAQAKRQAQAVASIPPPLPSAAAPRRLPQPVSRLVGREQVIVEVSACLSRVRLLTLTGAGGVGKTRLAIAVAETVAEEYPDEVFFVDLAPLSDPALIPQMVAVVLEVREEPGRPLLETLRDSLQSKSLLLVLDNCEHLLEGCASLATTLLESSKHLKILATSRQSLGITGELVWRVPSLPVPPVLTPAVAEKEPVGVWLEYAGVQMFVDRAQLVSPAFRLTSANVGPVIAICRQLEGIPLALELAAARLRGLTVEQIAERLGDRFRLLTGGSRTAPTRQQTLQAATDWSHDLLSEPEKRLLQRLSVFAGGWTLDAAEQVCAGKEIESGAMLDLLTSLVDKSLVMFQEDIGRYRLLETIRQYAQEQLSKTDEEALLQKRHLDYFLALVEDAIPKLQGPEQKEWLKHLEAEHDNLHATLAWCKLQKEGAEAGLRLAGALWRFWEIHGYLSAGRACLEEALRHEGATARTRARAKALNGAGALACNQGDYEAAKAYHEESLAIRRELGDKRGIAVSLCNLGNVASDQGDYQIARALHEQSLAIERELANRHGIADSLNNMGNVAYYQGDYGSAKAFHEESLAIRRELGDMRSIAASLHNMGNIARDQGESGLALALYQESLAIRRQLGDRQGIATSLNDLGNAAHNQGDYGAARVFLEESLAIHRVLEDKRGIAVSLNNLGNVALAQGDYGAAKTINEESLAMDRELKSKRGIAISLANLGNLALYQCDYEAAKTYHEESLAIKRELGNKQSIAYSLEAFALLALTEEQPERAARLWGAAEALREAIHSPLPPNERGEFERDLAAAKKALSAEAFAAAWAEGRAMTLEQSIEYALSDR